MVPTVFEIRAVPIHDPHPPPGDLDPTRQVLIVQIAVRSPLTPHAQILLLAGESLPQLIAMLQTVCAKTPALTTERAEREGVAVSGEEGKMLNLVPGPEGEQ